MIAVDVGKTHIKVAELTGKSSGTTVKSVYRTSSEGVLDADGNLDIEALSARLKEIFVRIKQNEVWIVFSGTAPITNEYTLPYDKAEANMLEMIKSKVFGTLSPEEYVMDYRILGIEDKQCKVATYVAPIKFVKDAEAAIRMSGKTPMGFCIAQNCILDLANVFFKGSNTIFVNMGEQDVTAHLVNCPNSVVTRNSAVQEGNDLLGLGGADDGGDVVTQTVDLIGKMVQYQTIKNIGVQIDSVVLMGEAADEANKQIVKDSVSITNVLRMSEAGNALARIDQIETLAYCVGMNL